MKIKLNLPDDIYEIAKVFKDANFDIFVVGGFIRDSINGNESHDIDLVTNALPEESKQILKDFNVSDEQGKNFGVLRIYTKDEPLGYELATYRKDISKGRDTKGNNKVEIGKHLTIEDDVKRRDLTINALFYDINRDDVIDIVNGIDDLNNKVIRTVGEPIKRFDEDRLRILRTLRFTARIDGKIDILTHNALLTDNRLKNISNIDDVSQERIVDEFYKILEKSPVIINRYIMLLNEYNMWSEMFNNLKISKNIQIKNNEDFLVFLKIFKQNNIKSVSKYMIEELKFSKILINKLIFFKKLLNFKINDVYRLCILKKRYNINNDDIIKFIDEFELNNYLIHKFIKYCDLGFTINGNELMKIGFKNKEIAIEKERLENNIFKQML